MALAFGALQQPLSLAAAAANSAVLVAAAGVVVVLAILLVFVMVLRGNNSTRQQRGSGLDYDAQRGPVGQAPAPAGMDSARGRGASFQGAEDPYGAQDQGYDQGYGQGYDQNYDQGYGAGRMPSQVPAQEQGWGAQFADQGMGGNQGAGNPAWGAPSAQNAPDPWSEPAAAAGGRGAAGAGAWGATPAQGGQMNANPWDAPASAGSAGSAWGEPAEAAGAAGGWGDQGGFGASQGQPAQGAGAWGGPPSQQPSQPAWGGPPPQQPSQPAWGGPPSGQGGQGMGEPWGAPPTTPSQGGWGAQPAPAIPQQPSQPAWGGAPSAPGGAPASTPMGASRGAAGVTPTLIEKAGKNPGAEYPIRKDRTTIGRHRDSDIFLEDLAVSRLHTSITRDPSGQCVLRDENSANGTLVNGQRVTEQTLRDGDEVQVGQTTLVFQRH